MVAQRIAFRPVIDVIVQPALEQDQIARLVSGMNTIRPVGGDEGLLVVVRLQQFFADREYLLPRQVFDFSELLPAYLCHDSGLHTVEEDALFEKVLRGGLGLLIRLLRQFRPDCSYDIVFSYLV
jgi:hypothetical protein